MNFYKQLNNYLENETSDVKNACYVLSTIDLEGFLNEWYTKGQIIRRKYKEIWDKYRYDVETAKPLLYKAFDLLLDFNKERQKIEDLQRELRHDIYDI